MTTKDVTIITSFTKFYIFIKHVITKRKYYGNSKNVFVKFLSFHCTIYAKAKNSYNKFAFIKKCVSELFALIHNNFNNKFLTPSLGGSNYYVSFIDDYIKIT